jgi:hypothetical protein
VQDSAADNPDDAHSHLAIISPVVDALENRPVEHKHGKLEELPQRSTGSAP